MVRGNIPNERHQISEELVEQRDTLSSLGAHAQSTSLTVGIKRSTCVGSRRKLLGDEVGVEHSRAVVGETLAGFHKGDGVHGPLDLSRHAAERVKLLLGGEVIVSVLRDGAGDMAGHVNGALGGDLGDAVCLGVDQPGAGDGVGVEVAGARHFEQLQIYLICVGEGGNMGGDEVVEDALGREGVTRGEEMGWLYI